MAQCFGSSPGALIFWQGDVAGIAEDLTSAGLVFERPPATGDGGGIAALQRDPDGHPLYFINLPGIVRGSD